MEVTSLVPSPQPAARPAAIGADASGNSDARQRVEPVERLFEQAVSKTQDVAEEPLGKRPQKLKVTLDIEEGTNRVIASLIDPETGEVKQELPPEELLESAAQLRELLDRIIDIKV
ncbi:flagellar protein FlaG [Algihabitans albus]|uniref:flagellar protein FlaG n=1 Tax=Algihabitans albus TaxID=2164067 RepID=UPI000E5CED63|nr:flagellar protein FlaG [Algihabitans albus]